MSEIQVGEYIRTKKGVIRKVKTIKTGKRDFSLTQQTLINGKYKIEEIVNHSFEPIDLIEEGDYVNGHRVKAVYLDGVTKYIKLDNSYEDRKGVRTYSEDIKSILTKQQFSNIEYKVVE